jgi:hypothetical protein
VRIAKSMVDAAMKKLALIAVLALAASPVAAQMATTNAQELSGEGALTAPSQAPTTGVVCIEEIAGTLCNVITGPSNGGYGTGSVTVGSSAPPVSIPPCTEFPPANELCN